MIACGKYVYNKNKLYYTSLIVLGTLSGTFQKNRALDDANSFLFNAYSVSSKKVYAIRAPDHPPTKEDVFMASFFVD